MLQEINNFMNSLPAELKQAGLKPKEGLHVRGEKRCVSKFGRSENI